MLQQEEHWWLVVHAFDVDSAAACRREAKEMRDDAWLCEENRARWSLDFMKSRKRPNPGRE